MSHSDMFKEPVGPMSFCRNLAERALTTAAGARKTKGEAMGSPAQRGEQVQTVNRFEKLGHSSGNARHALARRRASGERLFSIRVA